jgi:hypothetical protein
LVCYQPTLNLRQFRTCKVHQVGHEQRQRAEDNPVAMTAASNAATSAAGDGRYHDTAANAAGDCINGLLCHICNVLIDLVAP